MGSIAERFLSAEDEETLKNLAGNGVIVYKGEFKDGIPDGMVKVAYDIYSNAYYELYEGEWKDGKLI